MESHEYYQPFCESEQKYSYTWRQARYELERMKRDGAMTKGFHLAIYFCKKCSHFHVGSQANKVRGYPKTNGINFDGDD